jgi:transglutaminase-like putative cysteine protease
MLSVLPRLRGRLQPLVAVAASLCLLLACGAATATGDPPSAAPAPGAAASAPVVPPPYAPDNALAIDAPLAEAMEKGPKASEWPNNDYARLLDYGQVTVKSDGTAVGVYREAYRLFNERARDRAEVELKFNASYQDVHIIQARTISKSGKITPVKTEDIRSSSPFGDFLMYDDAKAVSFSMPAIENDCVIDYTYEMITRPLLLPGQFWTYWGFSGIEPVYISRYVLQAPADKTLHVKTYNDPSITGKSELSADGKTRTYTWEKRNIPPIAVEPEMPTFNEVHSWLEVSSLNSWQDISQWFWSLEKPQAIATDGIRRTVEKIIAGKTTTDEKARAIYDWVANTTRYVGLEFGISAFKPHAAGDVHDKLYGDCKDKATLLITMLSVAGIPAHPVLLEAEDRARIGDRLPSPEAFNHCIALANVNGRSVWLDATAETCAYGDIPDGDRGAQALVVREGAGHFETIPSYRPVENGADMMSTIDVGDDGSANVHSDMTWRGATGQAWRATIRGISPDKRAQVAQGIAQSMSVGAKVTDFALPDGTIKEGPFKMGLVVSAPNWAKKTGSLMLLPVSAISMQGERKNPFVEERRTWPVVNKETSQTTVTTVIKIPTGWNIEDVPANIDVAGPLQEFHRAILRAADGRSVTVKETTTERDGSIPPGDYDKIRSYYDSCLKVADDQIVLKRAK